MPFLITRWTDRDEAFYDVVKGINTAIKALLLARKAKEDALLELKRYEEALTAYEQAIGLDPNNALAYSNKGYALLELKRYEEALAACEQAISLDPNLALAYSNKGATLRALRKSEEAQQAFEKARQLGYNS